jgi:hypothetical protein
VFRRVRVVIGEQPQKAAQQSLRLTLKADESSGWWRLCIGLARHNLLLAHSVSVNFPTPSIICSVGGLDGY